MVHHGKHIDDVRLADVLPGSLSLVADELYGLARELEVHPLVVGNMTWVWFPERRDADPEGGVGADLLSADILLPGPYANSLELSLGLYRRSALVIEADVWVDCWCEVEHGQHALEEQSWPVTSGRDLIEGFAAGSTMLRRILDTGPLDANAWRERAGLPAPG